MRQAACFAIFLPALVILGLSAGAWAQANQPAYQGPAGQPGVSAGPGQPGVAQPGVTQPGTAQPGAAQPGAQPKRMVSLDLMLRHAMVLMNAPVYLDGPAGLRAQARVLGLNQDQLNRLAAIEDQAREQALAVLTPEQRSKLGPLPDTPVTMDSLRTFIRNRLAWLALQEAPEAGMMPPTGLGAPPATTQPAPPRAVQPPQPSQAPSGSSQLIRPLRSDDPRAAVVPAEILGDVRAQVQAVREEEHHEAEEHHEREDREHWYGRQFYEPYGSYQPYGYYPYGYQPYGYYVPYGYYRQPYTYQPYIQTPGGGLNWQDLLPNGLYIQWGH